MMKHMTAIECYGVALPNFTDTHLVTSHTGLFPYAHDVIYMCYVGGHRFDHGNTITTATCSVAGWAWNQIVTSCGRMSLFCFSMCHRRKKLYVL